MTDKDSVGSRIRECRKKTGLTQEQLAEKVNISPTYLSEIETDRKQAGRKVLCTIAEVLDVSLDYLMYARKEHNGDIRAAEWRLLLDDCTGYERGVLYDLAKSAKSILRENSRLLKKK